MSRLAVHVNERLKDADSSLDVSLTCQNHRTVFHGGSDQHLCPPIVSVSVFVRKCQQRGAGIIKTAHAPKVEASIKFRLDAKPPLSLMCPELWNQRVVNCKRFSRAPSFGKSEGLPAF